MEPLSLFSAGGQLSHRCNAVTFLDGLAAGHVDESWGEPWQPIIVSRKTGIFKRAHIENYLGISASFHCDYSKKIFSFLCILQAQF